MDTSQQKVCQSCKNEFFVEPEDFDFYEKIQVPPPTRCPECRFQRRAVTRNERSLYRDVCDLCGKQMLSVYSPGKPFKVYCRACWNSDAWDPLEYGADYDWQKPFFQQFREPTGRVPQIGLMQLFTNVNTDYANFIADGKNIYLTYSSINSENIYYSRSVDNSKDCMDSFNLNAGEMVYENVDGARNYNSKYLFRSRDCINSSFLFDCVNCQDCFMSFNLRNKRFVVRNKQYKKEDYAKELEKENLGNYRVTESLKEEFLRLVSSSLHKFANITKSVNSSGDNIENSKNVKLSFDAYGSEDVKFSSRVLRGSKDVYDAFGVGHRGELLYEGVASGYGSYQCRFVMFTETTRDASYVDWCLNSNHLFGCTALRKKEYCILNKQYSREEYERLIPKIVEHMNVMPYTDKNGRIYTHGEFFPPELSKFAYNETIAQEYLPLTREEALREGYCWEESEQRTYRVTKEPEDLPDYIGDALDSVIEETIGCAHKGACNEQCTTAFRIIAGELDFYRRMQIPLPRLCPNCRHYQRFKQRNPLKLWRRRCMCQDKESRSMNQESRVAYTNTIQHFHGEGRCPNEFETSYAPERPEIVYCEQCYQSEVI